jgi:hypothetical protein
MSIAMNNRVTSVSPLLVPLDVRAESRQQRDAVRQALPSNLNETFTLAR